MLFNSYEFIAFFLPLTMVAFYFLKERAGPRCGLAALTCCSLLFYAWWEPIYLALLGASICVNFGLGKLLLWQPRRVFLSLGVVFNLGLLGYFKYANFFVEIVTSVVGSQYTLGQIVLPLAISFFTFQQIAFLVDCKRGNVTDLRLLDYILFVTFFPQLIAGPIVHHRDLMPQLLRVSPGVCWESVAQGLTLFSIGLFKKVILADKLVEWVIPVYADAAAGNAVAATDAWGGTLAYAFQLYFDFSGYSDMAIGLAALFGIRLSMNFDSPYKATSIGELWNRWHISLSRFLRDYLYIPLGGNRCGPWRDTRNIVITMVVCGIWHGAGWTYVAFGFMHGAFVSLYHWWRVLRERFGLPGPPKVLAWAMAFGTFVISLVIFRSDSMASARLLYESMFGLSGRVTGGVIELKDWLRILAMFPIVLLLPNAVRWVRQELPHWKWEMRPALAVASAGLLLACLLQLNENSEFLYFNF